MLQYLLPLINILVPFSLALLELFSGKQTDNTFRFPRLLLHLGLYFEAALGIAVYFGFKQGDFESNYWILVVPVIMFFIALMLIAIRVNWKIEFNDDEIVYVNLFRVSYRLKYTDITEIKVEYSTHIGIPEKIQILFPNKKVGIEYLAGDLTRVQSILKSRLDKHNHSCKLTFYKNGVDVKSRSLKKQKNIVIKQPFSHMCAFAVGTCVIFSLAIIIMTNQDDWSPAYAAHGLVLICCFAILYQATWRIELIYGEPYFIYRSLFVKSKKIYYSSCKGYFFDRSELLVKCNGRTIKIPLASKYSDAFLNELKNQGVKKTV